MTTADRRRHRRFTFNVPALVRMEATGEEIGGRLYDMSQGGAFIAAPAAFSTGAAAFARFYVAEELAEAVGSVVRTVPFGDEQGLGIEFRVGNDPFVDFLTEIAEAREGARPVLLGSIRNLFFRIGAGG